MISVKTTVGAWVSPMMPTFVVEATEIGPWLLGAVAAMAAFVAVLVRWMMARADAMSLAAAAQAAEERKQAIAREERMQQRADDATELSSTQVLTLQTIATTLGRVDGSMARLPQDVADEIESRRRA